MQLSQQTLCTFGLLLLASTAIAQTKRVTAIEHVRLIDGTAKPPRTGATVVVEGARIESNLSGADPVVNIANTRRMVSIWHNGFGGKAWIAAPANAK